MEVMSEIIDFRLYKEQQILEAMSIVANSNAPDAVELWQALHYELCRLRQFYGSTQASQSQHKTQQSKVSKIKTI